MGHFPRVKVGQLFFFSYPWRRESRANQLKAGRDLVFFFPVYFLVLIVYLL